VTTATIFGFCVTVKAADVRKLLVFEMGCHRRILNVCWKIKISNKTFREKVQRHCTVVDLIKQRKLKLFGHVCRMDDNKLIKTVLLGMMEGNRPCGRPARRWLDDIVDWCGCSLPEEVLRKRSSRKRSSAKKYVSVHNVKLVQNIDIRLITKIISTIANDRQNRSGEKLLTSTAHMGHELKKKKKKKYNEHTSQVLLHVRPKGTAAV